MILDSVKAVTKGFTLCLSQDLLAWFNIKNTLIFACEAFAPLAALWNCPQDFVDRDCLAFIDNEAACAALVRGSSSAEDVEHIALLTHILARHWEKTNPQNENEQMRKS